VWVGGYILPVVCNNTKSIGEGVCTKEFISVFLVFVSIIGGTGVTCFNMALFSYACSWCIPADLPFCQSLIYVTTISSKIVSSTVFTLTMKSPQAQSIFFMAISGLAFLSTFALLCIFFVYYIESVT